MIFRENLGSIFLKKKISGNRIDIYYGFRDGDEDHAHVVLIDGVMEYHRGVIGLEPIIKSIGSVYF